MELGKLCTGRPVWVAAIAGGTLFQCPNCLTLLPRMSNVTGTEHGHYVNPSPSQLPPRNAPLQAQPTTNSTLSKLKPAALQKQKRTS
jgi:hypothetical protein